MGTHQDVLVIGSQAQLTYLSLFKSHGNYQCFLLRWCRIFLVTSAMGANTRDHQLGSFRVLASEWSVVSIMMAAVFTQQHLGHCTLHTRASVNIPPPGFYKDTSAHCFAMSQVLELTILWSVVYNDNK